MKTDITKQKQSRELQRLLLADTLEDLGIMRLVLTAIFTVSLFVVVLLIWAGIVRMEEVSIADGALAPLGKVKEIQHLEGGIVESVVVKDGDTVAADQILVELNNTSALTELREAQTQKISLWLDTIRIKSFVNDRYFDFQYIFEQIPDLNKDNIVQYKHLVVNALKLMKEQKAEINSKKSELEQEVAKLTQELEQTDIIIETMQSQLLLVLEKTKMYYQLLKTAISRVAYIDAKTELSRIEGMLMEKLTARESIRNELKNVEIKINTLDASYKEDARQTLNEIEGRLLGQKDTVIRLEAILARKNIRTTVDGVVKGISVDIGTALAPGGKVLEIVPLEQPLVARVKISPADIGYIREGSPVKIKVTSYNYAHFGSIDGEVENISATTFQEQDGLTYYEGVVRLQKSYFGDKPGKYNLKPGMMVTADIITGEKTILEYMLKPVKSLFDNSFKEK